MIKNSSWKFQSPRDELKLTGCKDNDKLVIKANGDLNAVSWWRGQVADLEKGCWYKAAVSARIKGIDQVSLSVFAAVSKHLLTIKETPGDVVNLEIEFVHENQDNGTDFDLFLRAADKGSVEYFEPRVYKIEKPAHRIARVAAIRFDPDQQLSELNDQRRRMAKYLDRSGSLNADIALLTEFSTIQGIAKYTSDYLKAAESVPDGPACRLFSKAAKQHSMYVIGGIVEQQGNYFYNTAVLFDRRGELAGKYRKTHLTYAEVVKGISPGKDYPVFNLDFGKIAIQTCYDQWFPEVARYYAHKGAEIIFEPVMGGKPITWRTRSIDNGIYIVTAGWTPPSMIIDSSGKILAENHHQGIAFTELNMDCRKVNVYKNPALIYGMPGIKPAMRMTADNNLIDELYKSMKG